MLTRIATRLKASGLWKETTLDYDPWDDERAGRTAFILDVLIAVGACIRREKTATGEYEFMSVEAPNIRVEENEDELGLQARSKISRSALRRVVLTSPFDIYSKKKGK
jgi:hypothetical protein